MKYDQEGLGQVFNKIAFLDIEKLNQYKREN